MKLKLLLLLISWSCVSIGQVTIMGNDVNLPLNSDIFYLHICDYIEPGNSGPDQKWDFSMLHSNEISGTGYYADSCSGGNIQMSSGNNLICALLTDSVFDIKLIYDGQSFFKYTNSEKLFQFPMSLDSAYKDVFSATFTHFDLYNGFRSGITTCEMDGYGTLVLPNQVYSDVARVKTTQIYTDSIDLVGTWLVSNYVKETFSWFKAGHKGVLASMTSYTDNGNSEQYGSYTILADTEIQEGEIFSDILILGNPVNDILNFNIYTLEFVPVYYELFDSRGTKVYSNDFILSPGTNTFQVPVHNIASGHYTLRVREIYGDRSKTKTIVKQ